MSRRNIELAVGASERRNLKGFPQCLSILRCCQEAAAIRILRSEEFKKIQASSTIVGHGMRDGRMREFRRRTTEILECGRRFALPYASSRQRQFETLRFNTSGTGGEQNSPPSAGELFPVALPARYPGPRICPAAETASIS